MFTQTTDARAVEWTSVNIPGVWVKVLHKDAGTGAMTVLTRLDAGATIPVHSHEEADERVFVLEGDFVEDGFIHVPGSFFFGQAGVAHGPHHSVSGCVILSCYSSTVDIHFGC
jgi:quercetin dioxygenase-like cupin family protein